MNDLNNKIHVLLSQYTSDNSIQSSKAKQEIVLAAQKLEIINIISNCSTEQELKYYLTKVLETFDTNVKLERVDLLHEFNIHNGTAL